MNVRDEKQELPDQPQQSLPITPPKRPKRTHLFFRFLSSVWNWVCRSPISAVCTVILIVSMAFCLFAAPAIGTAAGSAIGSWRGVSAGLAEGAKAGKEAGLSAEDTEARIGNKMTETGNLQVMLVDLNLTDLYQQGKYYAVLWRMQGEGVFSVDLTQSKVSCNQAENKITITILEPVFTSYLDDSTVESLAEHKDPLWNGSTVDGYRGYLNSRSQVERKVQEEMLSMVDQAKLSALSQVELLARSVCGCSASVQVGFMEEEG